MIRDTDKFSIIFTPGEKFVRGIIILFFLLLLAHRAMSQELPKQISVKESAEIQLAHAQLEILSLRQKILEMELRERLMTQLRSNGISDKDFDKYQYNPETLTFTLKGKL